MIRPLLIVALLLAVPVTTLAQFGDSTPSWAMGSGPSRRWGSVDVGAMIYTPGIDDEFGGGGPVELHFGTSRRWMFQLGISRALYTKLGSLEAGFRTGYWTRTGNALVCVANCDTPTPTYDEATVDTKLRIIPTSVSLTYRFDWHIERGYPIPLVPYVRATFERYNWWISDFEGTVERGATMGWSATGGVAFLLDILDPVLAREFDRDSGVNNTYVFAEFTKSSIDDFGSSSSWDMTNDDLALGVGLLFVF